jgi:signal transduction histidine kinase
MLNRLFFLTLFLGCYGSFHAQIVVNENFKHLRITEGIACDIDSQQVWMGKGIEELKTKLLFKNKTRRYIKHQNKFPLILKFEIKNTSNRALNCMLDINNVEIDYLQLVHFDSLHKALYKSPMQGDIFPFNKRLIPYRTTVFPLQIPANSSTTIMLGLYNKNRIITGFIDFDEADYWHLKTRKSSNYNGWVSGIYVGYFLLGLILFLIIKQSVYLFYSLYVFSIVLLINTIWGYPFQFLFPENSWLQDKFLLLVQLFGLLSLNLYALTLFQIDGKNRMLQKLKWYLILIFVLFMSIVLLDIGKTFDIEDILSKVLYFCEVSNFIVLILSGPLIYFIEKKTSGLVFFISFIPVGLSLLYSTLSFMMPTLPYILLMDSLSVTLFLEIFILSLFMVYQFKKSLIEKSEIQRQLYVVSKENQIAFMKGQEDEKKKIAMELHDSVATDLLLLKNRIEHSTHEMNENKKTIESVDLISHQIRSLSHELLPWSYHNQDFKDAIFNLIQPLSSKIDVHITIENVPIWVDSFAKTQLYRVVQELLKNTIKHANARSIYIQLVNYEDSIELHYEDDGKGFDIQKSNSGIGIKSIYSRVESIGGKINIESCSNNGILAILTLLKQDLKSNSYENFNN